MNDDQRLLASAALDGALTADDLARAEADPEVAEEVVRLRGVRAALQVDGAPDPTRRDDAIAAALAAFDGAATTAPPPVSLTARRRARWMAPLAAAAAVVAVVAAGAIVATRGTDGDDDSAAVVPANREVQQESAAATMSIDDDASQDAGAAAPSAAAPAPAAADEAMAATEAAGEASTTAPTADLAAGEPTLRTTDELVAFASRRSSTTADAAPTCDVGVPLGRAYYVVDGATVAVEVATTDGGREVVAVTVDGCEVVARAPLP